MACSDGRIKRSRLGRFYTHVKCGQLDKSLSYCILRNKSRWSEQAGHSHYCVFCMRLRQTVAFLQGDRKFPIFALMQPTAKNADRCV